MASLTPLSKGLIALAIVGGMASAVWHLALKERFAKPAEGSPAATAPVVVPASPTAAPAPTVAAPAPVPAPAPSPEPTPVAPAPAPAPAPAAAPATATAAEAAEQGRQALSRGDYAQARSHLEQAVRDGSGAAACLLGDMTLKGQGGIPASQDKAAALYQTAQARNTICFASGS